MNTAASLKFSDIQVSQVYQFKRTVSEQDVMGFAKLTGDFNPLHLDRDFAKKSPFKKNIVHGMLAAGLFSTLVGMYCPGEKGLYVSQTVKFRSPLYPGEEVTVRGTVTDKNESIRLITLKTEVLREEKIVINGEAKVQLTGDENG